MSCYLNRRTFKPPFLGDLMTEVEVSIYAKRPSGHKILMYRFELNVDNAAATERKIADFLQENFKVTGVKKGFGA
jgi:hypothetical protein